MELWRHAAGVASKEVWSSSVLFVVVGISSFRSSTIFAPKRVASHVPTNISVVTPGRPGNNLREPR